MHKFVMGDGNTVETTFARSLEQLEKCLNQLWICLLKEGNQKIVGFDLQWMCRGDITVRLVLCTDVSCFIIESAWLSRAILKSFLALKDITFVGIHIAKDLAKLEKDYGIVFRNAVDISEHAANVFSRPSLRASSVAELADQVNNLKLKEKPASITSYLHGVPSFDDKDMEYAAIDAYALFQIGKKLLERV